MCNFGRGYKEEQFCGIILNLYQWFKRRCLLKIFSSGALAAHLFSRAEPFVQFDRGHYEELGPVVLEMLFKIFLIWSFGGPSVQWS